MKLLKQFLPAFIVFIALNAGAQNAPVDSAVVDGKTYTKVEVEADYPGGIEAWKKFLIKTLNSEVPGKNHSPAGLFTVIAKFIVTKNGTVDSIAAETNNGFGIEEEVIRVIKKSGTWTPAMQNGKPVNAYRRQPITFVVEEDAFNITTQKLYTFYTGTDNELTVDAYKVNPEDLDITVTNGTVKQIAAGKFIVKVNKPGRVIVEVFNTKKNKSLGSASFVVMEKK